MRKLYQKASLMLVFILAIALLTAEPSTGQTLTKKPCLELFTSSSCPPCVFGNNWLRSVLESYPGTYTIIKYQMYWPGVGDPYCIDDGRTRKTYYAVTGVPSLQVNGTLKEHPASFSVAQMNSALAEKTGIGLTIQGAISEAKVVTVTLVINPQIAYAAGLKARIVVMERSTFNNATTNGEKIFDYVVQAVLPNGVGTTLDALVAGQPVTITLTKDMTGTHMETANDLYVAAFVQNDTDKAVLQSEIAPVSHPFAMFHAQLSVIDDDYNAVPKGELLLMQNAMNKVTAGATSFSGYSAGNYSYEYMGPGFEDATGQIALPNADFTGDIMLEKPDAFWFENFGDNRVPDGWNFSLASSVGIGWNLDGTFYMQNTGETADSYLVMPNIGLTQNGTVVFRAGQASGDPILVFGTVSGYPSPGENGTEGFTVTGFEEIGRATLPPTNYTRVNFRVIGGLNGKRPAFKFIADKDDYAYFDMVTVVEETPGAKATFSVKDQAGNVLGNTEVVFRGQRTAVNTHGWSTFRDTDPGTYDYQLYYKNTLSKSGTVTFTQDDVDFDTNRVIFNISYNTTGIDNPEVIPTFAIYPNPVKDRFVISGITRGTLTVMNLNGQMILNRVVENNETINLSDLAEGTYLVKFMDEKKTEYQKVVVRK